jgi:hypothetical protein
MRAIGLLLLLAGCLVLLWPLYGHLLHPLFISRNDAQLYGGAALMAGVIALVLSRSRAG